MCFFFATEGVLMALQGDRMVVRLWFTTIPIIAESGSLSCVQDLDLVSEVRGLGSFFACQVILSDYEMLRRENLDGGVGRETESRDNSFHLTVGAESLVWWSKSFNNSYFKI